MNKTPIVVFACWALLLFLTAAGCAATGGGREVDTEPPSDEALWADAVDPAEADALRERAQGMVDGIRRRRAEYTLGPEDQLRITVWNRPDLSKETRIRPDGVLFVPLVGNLRQPA